MKTRILSYILLFSITLFSQNKNSSIGFIENKGQIIDQNGKPNKKVKYLLNTNGLNVQIRENGFSYDIYETKKHKLSKKEIAKQNPFPEALREKNKLPDYKLEYIYHRIDIDFLNSRKNAKIIAEDKSTDYDNYYNVIGKPEGVLKVHKYKQITYENIYPNIDVVFSIPNDSLKPVEYNFVVKPNGKISDIQLKFNGAKTELLDNKIKLNVRFGAMEEILPMSWIENGKSKTEVAINYKKLAKNVYSFVSVTSSYGKTLVIDPVPIRLWGTYCGGDGGDKANKVIIDLNGNIYSGGITTSFNNISTIGAHQLTHWPLFSANFFDYDCFIVKMNSSGSRLWGTYLGGNDQDNLKDLAIDKLNNLIITGFSNSNLNSISSTGSYQQNLNYNFLGSANNIDAFLVKFNENGTRIWGTFYGGNFNDISNCLSVNELNEIIISGITFSETAIATPGSHKTAFSNSFNTQYDGFIAKFDTLGNRIWGTYFGGDMQENINDVKTDNLNNIYIAGNAYSTNGISTLGSFQYNRNTNWDGFVSKFSSTGNQIWGTYFGGESEDHLNKLVIGSNSIYLAGKTSSNSNISSANAFISIAPHTGNTGYDGILLKFDFNGNRIWSTYFYDDLYDLDIDNNENIFFVGQTQSDLNIATANSYQSIRSFSDGFIQKFNTNGQKIWGTYYGGESIDGLYSIKCDNINNFFYVGGYTLSYNDIATSGTLQSNYSGNFEDGLIAKFQDCLSSPQVSINNPCIGNTLNLTASGGTNYSWTGPNGFTSSSQNPTITNAQTINSGQYTCTITGTGGCDGTISTTVTVGDNTKPIPNQTTLPTITGDCNTTISTIPTATDNCAGIINGTTTDALSYALPGTYTINWKYDDGNGNVETQQQSIVITTVALPTLTSPQSFCIQQNPTLNSISINGQNIKWYDAQTLGNLLPSSTVLINGSTYYASQTINSCESLRVPITINIQNTAAPTGNANQSFCATQNATLNEIAISGNTINWYSSPSSTVILPTTTLLVNGSTYYATQTINGCESVNRIAVTITLTTTLNANNYSKSFCDDLDDGLETILLSDYNSFLLPSVTNEIFTYYNSNSSAENQIQSDQINLNYTLTTGNHIVFVRIDSSNGCHQVVELNLTLFSNPVINLKDIIPICENKDINVNAGNGFDSYTWSTGITNQQSILITQPGSYSLTVTKNNGSITCSKTKNFTVVNSNTASISSIETSDWTDNQNTISVFLSPSSVGNYEYSLDGIKYQDSPIFDNLMSGFYTVYVNDKNDCGEITDEVFLLMYPTFFTPNNDGYNDYWKIKLSELEPGLTIKIFDRFGKFIKLLDNDDISWDGTYIQKPLPADDYWFVITRANGKEYRNHFTLKR
ncbi:MAG: T9SS type B sorting domain-containing protein [Flavobacterium sp.]|uniref:DUF7948 domain-containing protein n=1 Tax=Flavobacterium sp. TaxID=239 RepID=UPI0022C52346|nr:T9SS type B sorting domain-containing protein [Flavobacterium sp.]MCZ8197217.1 T9SS type B sorting domain-containing protein [Flavobacterium sp.]